MLHILVTVHQRGQNVIYLVQLQGLTLQRENKVCEVDHLGGRIRGTAIIKGHSTTPAGYF